jgi:parvulin-like peptidyl-prolyl isomerase
MLRSILVAPAGDSGSLTRLRKQETEVALSIRGKGIHVFFSALVVFGAACGLVDHPEQKTVITVGSRNVTTDELKRDLKRMAFDLEIERHEMQSLLDPLLDKLVENYLILEYGRRESIEISDWEVENAVREIRRDYHEKDFQEILLRGFIDYEDWKQALREQLLLRKIVGKAAEEMEPVPVEEIKAYYDEHPAEFGRPAAVRFRQIVTSTKGEAQKALKRLNDGEDMDSIIEAYTKAKGKEYGGEVHWVSKGDLDETVEKVIFSLPVGKFSNVEETPYGFHLFEVLDRRPEGVRSFPEAIPEIESKLHREKEEAFITQWVESLRAVIPVKVHKERLKELELG